MFANITNDEIIIDLMNMRQNLNNAQVKHFVKTANSMEYAIETFRARMLIELAKRDHNTLAIKSIGLYCQKLRSGMSARGDVFKRDDCFVKRYMGLFHNAGTHNPIDSLIALERDKLNHFTYDMRKLEDLA